MWPRIQLRCLDSSATGSAAPWAFRGEVTIVMLVVGDGVVRTAFPVRGPWATRNPDRATDPASLTVDDLTASCHNLAVLIDSTRQSMITAAHEATDSSSRSARPRCSPATSAVGVRDGVLIEVIVNPDGTVRTA